MIPSEIRFDGNATPPQWTDNQDQVIEKGSHIRIKVKGIRGEVNEMFAIATIKEVANPIITTELFFIAADLNRTILGMTIFYNIYLFH